MPNGNTSTITCSCGLHARGSESHVIARRTTDDAETDFDRWWDRAGRFVDPDTADVPWFDKREALARAAFAAARETIDMDLDRSKCPDGCGNDCCNPPAETADED